MSASYSIFIVVLALTQTITGKPATDSFRSSTIQVQQNGKVDIKYQTQEMRSSGSRAPSYFFQHDMLMRKATIKKALQGKDVTKPDKNARKCANPPCAEAAGFVSSSLARWPNPRRIPYVMSKSAKCSFLGKISHFFKSLFDKSKKCHETAIRDGIKGWEAYTCIRFVEIDEEDAFREPGYIEFTSGDRKQCYAHVGFIGGRQVINIDDGCSTTGIVLHEIGHALGLHHEQSRPDRDSYIRVYTENIRKGTELNFKKYSFSEINTVGTKYDYHSIMHYNLYAFSANGRKTLDPIRREAAGVKIGQRQYLSGTDVKAVNKYYGC